MVQFGSVLVATLAGDIEDDSAVTMQSEISALVVERRATGVLLDLSALEIVDSYISKVLGDTAKIVRILGAQVALVGMRPAVAITLVELGLSLEGIAKALTLDAGMALLAQAARGDDAAGSITGDRLR